MDRIRLAQLRGVREGSTEIGKDEIVEREIMKSDLSNKVLFEKNLAEISKLIGEELNDFFFKLIFYPFQKNSKSFIS